MSRVEVVRIPVAAEQQGPLVEAVARGRSGYLAAPRCERVATYTSEDTGEVIVVVRWSSDAAHDEALAEPAAGEFFGAVQELAAGEPRVGFYHEAQHG